MTEAIFKKIDHTFDFKNYEFKCEVDELNNFFYKKAKDFIKEDFCQMYILKIKETPLIIGYFTLSNTSITQNEKEAISIKKVARFVPCILLGMFAINDKYQKSGFGTDLIKKAVKISTKISRDVGCRCLIVDSKTKERLIKFYMNRGFDFVSIPLGSSLLKKFENNNKIDKPTVKMYLDFHKLEEQIDSDETI